MLRPNTFNSAGMTRFSDLARRNSTACSRFSTPADGLRWPFMMIWEGERI